MIPLGLIKTPLVLLNTDRNRDKKEILYNSNSREYVNCKILEFYQFY